MDVTPATGLVIFYRISIALSSIFFAWLGYKLLGGGLSVREGEIEIKVGKFKARAVKVTAGSIFSLCGMGVLVTSLLHPPSIRIPNGIEIIARLDESRTLVATLAEQTKNVDEKKIVALADDMRKLTNEVQGARKKLERVETQQQAQTKAIREAPGTLQLAGIIESDEGQSAVARDTLGRAYVLRPGDRLGADKIVSVKAGQIELEGSDGAKHMVAISAPKKMPTWKLVGKYAVAPPFVLGFGEKFTE